MSATALPQGAAARPAPAMARPAPLRLGQFGLTPFTLCALLALTIAQQFGFLGIVLYMKHLSDGVIESRNLDTLAALSLVFVGMLAVSTLAGHFRSAMLAAAAERFGLRLKLEAMQAAVRNAVRTDAGSALPILRDIATVQRFFSSRTPAAILDLLGAVIAILLLFYLDFWLGMIGLGGMALSALIGAVVLLTTRQLMLKSRSQLDAAQAELGSQFLHPDVVRGLGLLPATLLRWHAKYNAALDAEDASQHRFGTMHELDHFISHLVLIGAFMYGAYLVIQHEATVGLLLAITLALSAATQPFSHLFHNWAILAQAAQAWQRLRSTMRQDGEPPVHPPEVEAATGLVIEDLGFWPEGRPQPILKGIGLRVAPGTMMTVQGPNGVGKSTLLRLVLGLMPPTSGRVLLDGQDSWHCDRAAFGARIGYLPQDVQLLEGDIFRNIGRGPGAAASDVVAAARAAGAHDMIGRLPLGYQTPAGTAAGLSAGQRRLIGLARALYRDPRLLVLDEPEVGMDGQSRAVMRRAVEEAKARGAVVLLVTHEPRTWNDLTDLRLLLGKNGQWQVRPAEQDADIMGGSLARVD
ncbi:ATP-binding cassette domain-containing protein [Siccirubricoccus sp. KC 17139]|uniref:ATP-binding cassette domain-containing protein n=1 Tax=Siccirubricoccus soli TaxID=2899147 RepID=A0ABT1D7N3_9PROT|nr:ATP-binding cassette domain-containing protein [Siccirubricoccus soli]MCO6417179.1 ATP-binding cassette domain-containing protein [Siccirubricoccus soli]MCP2683314.1 ATP-binding cassette domain-containing protein [Siccirubricoccus soli]